MKKRHLFWIIPCSLVVGLCLISLFGHLLSPIKVKKIPLSGNQSKNKSVLTEEELKEDLAYIKYYFENIYIGYHFLQQNDYDIDEKIQKIYEKCVKNKGKNPKIQRGDFQSYITETLFEDWSIEDQHFAACGLSPKGRMTVYFSDIYLRAENSPDGKKHFYIYKHEVEPIPEDILKSSKRLPPAEVKIGQEYTGPLENLYPCYDGEELVYRFGVFTEKRITSAYINIEGKKVLAPVLAPISISIAKNLGFVETNNTLYLSIGDFFFNGRDNVQGKRKLNELCVGVKEKSKDKKNIIIDLRNNGGGYIYIRDAVFGNLMYNNREISEDLIKTIGLVGMEKEQYLFSPAMATIYRDYLKSKIKTKFKNRKFKDYIEQYDYESFLGSDDTAFYKRIVFSSIADLFIPTRRIQKSEGYKLEKNELPEPDFKGNIIILTNRYSASCSEYSVALAREFEKFDGVNVYHIGENTCGAVDFINPCGCILPNSYLYFYMPNAYNESEAFKHPKYHGEGKGWYPDFWASSIQIMDVINHYIDDKELNEALKGLERRQL